MSIEQEREDCVYYVMLLCGILLPFVDYLIRYITFNFETMLAYCEDVYSSHPILLAHL